MTSSWPISIQTSWAHSEVLCVCRAAVRGDCRAALTTAGPSAATMPGAPMAVSSRATAGPAEAPASHVAAPGSRAASSASATNLPATGRTCARAGAASRAASSVNFVARATTATRSAQTPSSAGQAHAFCPRCARAHRVTGNLNSCASGEQRNHCRCCTWSNRSMFVTSAPMV